MKMVTLGEVMNFQNGRAFKSTEWREAGLPIIRIQNLNNQNSSYNYFDGAFDERILIADGDLLFSWSGTVGTSFGPHIWTGPRSLLNQHIFKVELNASIEKKYAYYALLSITSRIEENVNGSVGLTHITKAKLVNFEIPLPSLHMQREIIERLDSAFADIDILQENYIHLRNSYNELLHSFQMSLYGRNVTKVKIGDVCKLMTGGTPSRTRDDFFTNGTVKWLVSGDIHKGEILDCEGRITIEAMKSSNTKILPINSVMIALNGQGKTRGTVALLKTEATCNQSLVSISPVNTKELMPEFLFYNLRMRYQELRRMTGDDGNDRRGLNMLLIREIEIPLPSMANQIEIAKDLKLADKSIQELKAQIQLKEQHAMDLRKSLLSNSFGEKREVS
jgi:type I restriction enzyme, S subunit